MQRKMNSEFFSMIMVIFRVSKVLLAGVFLSKFKNLYLE